MKTVLQTIVIILGLPIMAVSAVAGIISAFIQVGWGVGREDFWS